MYTKGEKGDPHVRFALTVLKLAKEDNTEMWQDYYKEFDEVVENVDPSEAACWVGSWWSR